MLHIILLIVIINLDSLGAGNRYFLIKRRYVMELIKSIIMGIVQGVCEFLPVSSSGHLAIFRQILNLETDTGLLFDILLHLGTLTAIFIAYWSDVKQLVVEGFTILFECIKNVFIFIGNIFKKKDNKKEYINVCSTPYKRFVLLVIFSTIPTGVLGILLKDFIEFASSTLIFPGIFLLGTACLLFIADRTKDGDITQENASFKSAGIIGIAQGIATMPGLSRSGTTITVCRLCGFSKEFAVKYSFIMSIPAVLGSVVLELKDFSTITITTGEVYCYIVGTIVAGVVGYICIMTMLKIVRNSKFTFFTIYCAIVGISSIVAHFII